MARTLAMFTDTSLCIGCRACQVACKQWNELPAEQPEWTGSYQNHATFTDKTYRLVRFMEKPQPNASSPGSSCRTSASTAPRRAVSTPAPRGRSIARSSAP